jgi:hypothetical protein
MDKQKKACINVKSRGNKRFLWPVLLALHFPESEPEIVTKFQQYKKKVTKFRKYLFSIKITGKVKVIPKQAMEALGLREVQAPTFSDIRLTDGGKVVSPTRRPLFTPRKIAGIHFC